MLRSWALGCFTYFGLVYYSQGVIAALQAARGDVARTVSGETNLPSTVAQSVILVGLAIAVLGAPQRYLRLCRPVLPVLAIAALALVSVAWSGDPVRTARRAVALAECTLFGMFLYRTDGLERTIGRVGRVCVAMAALSLLAYVAVPSIGRETALGYERAMRGVFPQKNSMSECMLLGVCCYAYRLVAAPRWRHVGAVALLTLCVLLGRGASALAVAGVILLVATWMGLRGKRVLRLGLVFLAGWSALALAAGLIMAPQEVFALVGRDASLTGRVPLWQAIWPEIMRSPLIGYGYAGFWNADSPTVQMIWRYAGWPAPDAHSSYLDILLQLGVAGLVLYAWSWAALFARARLAHRTGLGSARFVLLYGVTLLLIGLDEGAIPIPNAWTALFPLALLAMARHLALGRKMSVCHINAIADRPGIPFGGSSHSGSKGDAMLRSIALSVGLSLGLAAHGAAAAPVTEIFSIGASGFADVIGSTTPPADPVSLRFSLSFDPASGDQFDNAAGLTLLSSSVALSGTVVFDYDSLNDVLVFGAAGSSFSISAGTNDVLAQISSAYRGRPTVDGVIYTTAGSTGLYESFTGTVAVPEPASMLVVLGGLFGVGLTRRRT